MNRADKAQLLQWIVRDLGEAFAGIESNPLVCGGEPCIVRTRIPVWLLVQARNLGMSDADILKTHPTLRAEDLVDACRTSYSGMLHCEPHTTNTEGSHAGLRPCTFDQSVMGGRACIRCMRITVSLVVNLVANGMTTNEIVEAYPYLEPEDVGQALRFAVWLAEETAHPIELAL